MRFSVLSSGSRANCTYFEAGDSRILIDCGLSRGRTEERLQSIGISPSTITAVIITHEHHDHIFGLDSFTRRYKIPVYANHRTAAQLRRPYAVEAFTSNETFWVGSLQIYPFRISHDAVEPVGFTINAEGLRYGHVTDLGVVTGAVRESLRDVQALVLESNHDEDLLWGCGYPWELKNRIASDHGHLSNKEAGALLAHLGTPARAATGSEPVESSIWHVVLGHLSENSNRPDVALATVQAATAQLKFQSLRCGSVRHGTPIIPVEPRPCPADLTPAAVPAVNAPLATAA